MRRDGRLVETTRGALFEHPAQRRPF